MFIKDIIMEACIAYSEASKLTSITVRVSAALNRGTYQTKFQQFLIEEASMSA